MCFSSPSMPEPAKEQDIAPPPPPPPPPAPTAQGLVVGNDRNVSLGNYLRTAIGARKQKNPLRVDLGGTDASAGSGLNIPQG